MRVSGRCSRNPRLAERRKPAGKRARVEDERPAARAGEDGPDEIVRGDGVVRDDRAELIGVISVTAEAVAADASAVPQRSA